MADLRDEQRIRPLRIFMLTTTASGEVEALRSALPIAPAIVCAEVDGGEARRLRRLGVLTFGGTAKEFFRVYDGDPLDLVALDTCNVIDNAVETLFCLFAYRAPVSARCRVGVNIVNARGGKEWNQILRELKANRANGSRTTLMLRGLMCGLVRTGHLGDQVPPDAFLPASSVVRYFYFHKSPMESIIFTANPDLLQYRRRPLSDRRLAAAKAIVTMKTRAIG